MAPLKRSLPSAQSTSPNFTYLVEGTIRAAPLCLHHHVGVQKVGCNHVRHKGCVLILEDHGDDVVSNMPLPLQLSTGPQAFTAWPCRVWDGDVQRVWGWRGERSNQRAQLGMCAPAHPQYGKLVLRLFLFPWIPLTDEKMEAERRLIPRPPDALRDLNPGLEPASHLSAPPLSQSYLNTPKHGPSLKNEISATKRENQRKKPVRIIQLHHLLPF